MGYELAQKKRGTTFEHAERGMANAEGKSRVKARIQCRTM